MSHDDLRATTRPRRTGPPRALVVANVFALVLIAFEAGFLVGRSQGRRESKGPLHESAAPLPIVSAAPEVPSAPASAMPTSDAAIEDLNPILGSFDAAIGGPLDAAEPPAASMDDIEALLAILPMTKRDEPSLAIARKLLGPRTVHGNQGNPKIVHHDITRAQCLDGLKDVVVQTPAQRAICGADNEVPVYSDGHEDHARACMDVFEYPNQACIRPIVYTYGSMDEKLCALNGERLCTEDEWITACEADPSGGAPRAYAYGDQLDLTVCDTGKMWPPVGGPSCEPSGDVWGTCATLSEPAGSFPKCRSRLGVFDQHGNVAEAMTRLEGRTRYIQFKGSAFFYDGKMYPDTCRYDPRWHVDPVDASWHTNYHLGFRCCRDVKGR